MSDPTTTMTAVPGVSMAMARQLAEAPGTADVEQLVSAISRLSAPAGAYYGSDGASARSRERDFKLVGAVLDRVNEVLPIARVVGSNLAEMSTAEQMMVSAEQANQVAEMAAGYRRTLTGGGFSEPIADQMCLQLHGMLMMRAAGAPGAPTK